MFRKNETDKGGVGAGFTLLEVMIAMAILSIGILSVAAVQYMVVNGNTNGNVVTQQMMLAQRVMERIKNRPNPTGPLGGFIPAGSVDQTGDNPGPYTVTASLINPLGGTASRFVSVTVIKTGGVGGHPITLQSMTYGSGI